MSRNNRLTRREVQELKRNARKRGNKSQEYAETSFVEPEYDQNGSEQYAETPRRTANNHAPESQYVDNNSQRAGHQGDVSNNRSKKSKNNGGGQGKAKRSLLAPLLFIEAVLVVYLYYFLGIPIVATAASIPLLLSLVVKRRAKKGRKRPKGTFLIFIIYLLIVLFGIKTNGVLSSLVSSTQINQFYVVAMNDDSVDKLNQIEPWSTIALGPETSYQTNVFARAKFAEEQFEFNYENYEGDTALANALLSGEQRFIVVENYNSKELRNIENFKSNTKVIGHYKETLKIDKGSKNVKRQPFTVLITGVDSRDDSIDSNGRSDSLMVAKINPKTGSAALVSIPRDAYVNSSCIGGYDKITHSSLSGMNCLIDDVEGLLDIEIDYYLTVNFFAVIDAIDAVGGIDVEIEEAFCGQDEYDVKYAYCFEAGMQHLAGAEALSYARERSSFSDGDYARARHQQQVIDAFAKSVITSGPFAINSLLDVAGQSARTNLSAKQLTDITKVLQGSEDFKTESYTLQGYGMGADIPYWGLYGTSVQVIEEDSIAEAKALLDSLE